jgi:hypothetical protein
MPIWNAFSPALSPRSTPSPSRSTVAGEQFARRFGLRDGLDQ